MLSTKIDGAGVKNIVTKAGLRRMQEELDNLKKHSIETASEIAEAAEKGDLSENYAYSVAKEKQDLNQKKIAELAAKISNVVLIDTSVLDGQSVEIGTVVTLHEATANRNFIYTIVGEYDADLEKGYISSVSPLAKQLIHKKVGDVVLFVTPAATRNFTVLKIDIMQDE